MTKYAKRVYVMEEEAKKLDSLTGNLTSNDIISFAAGAPAKEAYPSMLCVKSHRMFSRKVQRAMNR